MSYFCNLRYCDTKVIIKAETEAAAWGGFVRFMIFYKELSNAMLIDM